MKFLFCLTLVFTLTSAQADQAKAEPEWLEQPLCKNTKLKDIEAEGRAIAKAELGGSIRKFEVKGVKFSHAVLRSKNDGFDKYVVNVAYIENHEGKEYFESDSIEISVSYPSCK